VLHGLVLIGLAAVSWGTTGSVMTILVARADAEPFLVGAARMAVAALVLIAGAKVLSPGPTFAFEALPHGLALGVCMAAYQAAYFSAVAMTGIAVTALVAICSAPLMIAALAVLLLGERPTMRLGIALALGVAGTAPPTTTGSSLRFLSGIALALTAGLAYAVYAVIAKAAVARVNPLAITTVTFTAAAVLMLPLLAFTHAPLTQVARGWPWLVYVGAVATAGAYVLYTLGLRRVPASVAGVMTLLEPLTATLLGVWLFGERLGPAGLVGAVLLLAAITLLLPLTTSSRRS